MWQVECSIQALLARQQHLQAQREKLSRTVTVNARAPKADWQGSFAWDQEVQHLLLESFGLQKFRFASPMEGSGGTSLLLYAPGWVMEPH